MTIKTTLDRKADPNRNFDWEAVRNDYDLGDPVGYGSTESAAVRALQEMIVDRQERFEVRYHAGGNGWYVHEHNDSRGFAHFGVYATHPEAHARLLELLEASWP